MNFIIDSLYRTSIPGHDFVASDLTSLLRRIAHVAHAPVNGMDIAGQAETQEDEFIELGEEMLCHARCHSAPLSLLVFELDDLLEFRTVFGERMTRRVLAQTEASLRSVATSRGMVAWTTPTIFTAVVPGKTGDQLAAALTAKLGPACCIEFDTGGDEILLVPEFRVETVGETGSLRQAYDAACRAVSQARINRERRRHFLRLERESHYPAASRRADASCHVASPVARKEDSAFSSSSSAETMARA